MRFADGTPGSARRARRSELPAETLQMGGALARLIADLDLLDDAASERARAVRAGHASRRLCHRRRARLP